MRGVHGPGLSQRAARSPRSRGKWRAALAIALAAVAGVANAADLLFLDYFGPLLALAYALGTFAGVGLIVALRRPEHPVGWLFLVAGVGHALTLSLSAYTWRALVDAPGSLPGGEITAWLTSFLWFPAMGSTLFAVALFPDGRPPSPRWRPVLGVMAAALGTTMVIAALAPGQLVLPVAFTEGPGVATERSIPNPIAAPPPIGGALAALRPITDAFAVPMFIVVIVAVAVRFRRSSGLERQQLKWFAFAAGISPAALTASFALPNGALADIAWVASIFGFGFVPVGAGIAILRYRLYEIDVVIRRTLVYAAVVAILGVVYVGLVLGTQALLTGVTQNQTLPVAVSTLAIAALFGPVRRRVRELVDRRFYRSRYDAQRTFETFAADIRDQVELEAVAHSLVSVAGRSVRPTTIGVWVRDRR